jgi:drug/metabolite transporter (DMT)-like permease
VNRGAQQIPALTFAAAALLVSAAGFFLYAVATGTLTQITRRAAWRPVAMVVLLVIVIPYSLFFLGASQTSGVNTSLLLLSELVFTVLFTPFFGEKTTTVKLLGAGGVLAGAVLIVSNGRPELNLGDSLIILSTVCYPFGNLYTKRALNHLSPASLLFLRSSLGGLVILALALAFEPAGSLMHLTGRQWVLVVLTGLLVLGVAKVLWHEGLKRVDISKAVSIGSTSPAVSLLALVLVFHEPISAYQLAGAAIMAVGVYFSIRRRSADPALTRYAPEA